MSDTTTHTNTLVGALAAHEAERTERVSVRTAGTSDWQTTYITTCTCGVTTGNHPEHVASQLGRAAGEAFTESARTATDPLTRDDLVSALTEVLEKVVVTTQGRTFKADGAHIMTFNGHKMPSVEKVLGDAARLPQSSMQANPLTRDDVRAIVSEEIGKLGGLLLEPVLDSDDAPLKLKDRVHGECSNGALDDLIWSPVVDNLEESIAEFVRDRQLRRDDLISQPVGGTHNSSPSVDDAGAHSVGDGPGAGDASATPATEAMLEYLVAAVRDANLDIKSLRRIDEAAQANYNESGRNLAKAIKDRTDSERALLDYLTGDRA
ncbi:hypothetical protein R3Q06_20475 [Rhodococcus erythropolis]|uniref:hypothetical protein n=1 Tax=Rhodococcus erythropolis TaxID=1833 RepID=UPI002948FF56|nr:hypothetical protein [Rhodococcus erythropolis]MDV6275874.1 hypothetical protein [Rhodococcus erythropolis]